MDSGDPRPSPERRFAEEFGVVGERVGMPRMMARLLGFMLICDPPTQSIAHLQQALGVSRASVSIATRLLQASGLIRRVAEPGTRGYQFEIDPAFFAGQMNAANPFGMLRKVLEDGIQRLPGARTNRGLRGSGRRAISMRSSSTPCRRRSRDMRPNGGAQRRRPIHERRDPDRGARQDVRPPTRARRPGPGRPARARCTASSAPTAPVRRPRSGSSST